MTADYGIIWDLMTSMHYLHLTVTDYRPFSKAVALLNLNGRKCETCNEHGCLEHRDDFLGIDVVLDRVTEARSLLHEGVSKGFKGLLPLRCRVDGLHEILTEMEQLWIRASVHNLYLYKDVQYKKSYGYDLSGLLYTFHAKRLEEEYDKTCHYLKRHLWHLSFRTRRRWLQDRERKRFNKE